MAASRIAGSAFAALVAIYLGALRAWWRRPKLTIDQPQVGRELITAEATIGDDPSARQDSAWVRLRVSAARGKESAEDAEVIIRRVREVEPRPGSPRATSEPALGGISLIWTHGGERTHIPADAERIVNLGTVYRSQTGNGPLVIQVGTDYYDHRQCICSLVTEVEFVVAARKTNARRYRVRVRYDGDWGNSTEAIWEHLAVESIEALPAPGRWFENDRSTRA